MEAFKRPQQLVAVSALDRPPNLEIVPSLDNRPVSGILRRSVGRPHLEEQPPLVQPLLSQESVVLHHSAAPLAVKHRK